jgi:hypothetical protein
MKIVITMTSWTKRINVVARCIYHFLTTQTIKPDIFYLWLAEEEFPNKEKDLPEDLLLVCEKFGINICWTKTNEYCFKRWYVYPKHYEDLVICIDDDIIQDPNTIKAIISKYNKNPIPQVIHYRGCGGRIIIKNEIEYFNGIRPIPEYDSANYMMGCCAFAPKSFPLNSFSSEMIELRKKICPKCDESWIHPFLIMNDIPITFVYGLKWKEISNIQNVAIRNDLHFNLVTINNRKYKKADIYKYLVLNYIPELKKQWKIKFPNYNFNHFKISLEKLLDLVK